MADEQFVEIHHEWMLNSAEHTGTLIFNTIEKNKNIIDGINQNPDLYCRDVLRNLSIVGSEFENININVKSIVDNKFKNIILLFCKNVNKIMYMHINLELITSDVSDNGDGNNSITYFTIILTIKNNVISYPYDMAMIMNQICNLETVNPEWSNKGIICNWIGKYNIFSGTLYLFISANTIECSEIYSDEQHMYMYNNSFGKNIFEKVLIESSRVGLHQVPGYKWYEKFIYDTNKCLIEVNAIIPKICKEEHTFDTIYIILTNLKKQVKFGIIKLLDIMMIL
jgi:hypothetical protein